MKPKQKILYISQEITPYLAENPISLLGKNIPQKVQEKGYEARAFMPKYGGINERRNQLHEVIRLSGINIVIDDTDHPLIIKVATLQAAKMQVYFIDSEDFFQHHPVNDLEIYESPEDNDERIMFFTRGTMETLKKLRWEPAMIHASGWVSALSPLYLKKAYADDPTIGKSPVVYTVYNDDRVGAFDIRMRDKLLLDGFAPADLASLPEGTTATVNDLHKLAIDHSDGIIFGHENLPEEVVAYARATGKPLLEWDGDEADGDRMAAFYDRVRGIEG